MGGSERYDNLGPALDQRGRDPAVANGQLPTPADTPQAQFEVTQPTQPIWGSRGRRFKSCQPDQQGSDQNTWSEPPSTCARSPVDDLKVWPLRTNYRPPGRERRSASNIACMSGC